MNLILRLFGKKTPEALVEASARGDTRVAHTILQRLERPKSLAALGIAGTIEKHEYFSGLSGGSRTCELNALYAAATNGHLEVVRLLIQHGAQVNRTVQKKLYLHGYTVSVDTPLRVAVRGAQRPVAELLLRSGADPNLSTFFKDQAHASSGPLNDAAKNGDVETAKLLFSHGAQPDGAGGLPPLLSAARGGHVPMIKLLLDAGADIHRRVHVPYCSRPDCPQAIHVAVGWGHLAAVEYLLDSGANINASEGGHEGTSCETPLDLAHTVMHGGRGRYHYDGWHVGKAMIALLERRGAKRNYDD